MDFSPLGFLLSLCVGVALAVYYTLNKKVAHAGSPLQIIFWIFAAHIPPVLIWAFIRWTNGACRPFDSGYFLPGLAVLLLTIAGNLTSIRALSLSPFSLMIPVMCLSPVFTSLIGIPLLHEWPTASQSLGIVLAVAGVLWLYAPPEKPWDIFSFWRGFFRERGAPYMAASALCWSCSSPMDKLALRHADPALHALAVFFGLTLFLFFWLSARREWELAPIARESRGWLALTGIAGAIADVTQLFALQHAAAGSVESIKRVVSQVLAVAIACYFFKEKLTLPKIIGIVIISIGVPMIVL